MAELGTGPGLGSQVAITKSPQQSVYLALREAASCRGPFSQRAVLEPLPALVSRPDYQHALLPTRRKGGCRSVPDALVPLLAARDVSVAEQTDALQELSGQAFLDEIDALGADAPAWRRSVVDPERWLRMYAELSRICWRALEGRWRLLGPAFDAEIERLGAASVRGCLVSALNLVSPRLSFTETGFSVDGHAEVPYAGRRVLLAPSLGGTDTLLVHSDSPDVVSIAYPLRDLPDVAPVPPTRDAVEVVLGVPRASILRMLDRPLQVGAVAARLGVTPAAASRHCDVLVRAGLVVRERRGREVLVIRTSRGGLLIDVL
jgi:DNA-binding transcriptional ArsR family regulator